MEHPSCLFMFWPIFLWKPPFFSILWLFPWKSHEFSIFSAHPQPFSTHPWVPCGSLWVPRGPARAYGICPWNNKLQRSFSSSKGWRSSQRRGGMCREFHQKWWICSPEFMGVSWENMGSTYLCYLWEVPMFGNFHHRLDVYLNPLVFGDKWKITITTSKRLCFCGLSWAINDWSCILGYSQPQMGYSFGIYLSCTQRKCVAGKIMEFNGELIFQQAMFDFMLYMCI